MSRLPDKEYNYCPRCATKLEIKLINGRERAWCPQCDWVHYEDPKVAAAVLVLQDDMVLLTRRIFDPHQGAWTLPAGFVDAFEDPQAAAIRECREETNLTVIITSLWDVIGGREHARGADMVIVYQAEVVGGELKAGDDADMAAFFPIHNLPPLAFRATQIVLEKLIKKLSGN
ncbi:MAG: hypothetical protein CVU39_15890 [Chloroflexi bacterium HGW-Chloroflexi-10]|nr:MAG: hypothetical protein CVU39_15890 [Chloroflexi bacterium HGW-Chloroflexi-10]